MRWVASVIIGIFFLGAASVYAADKIISPLPDPTPVPLPEIKRPVISFGDLLGAIPDSDDIVSPVPDATPSAAPIVTPQFTLIPTATPSPTIIETPTPTIQPRATKKRSFTISLVGDSMIDTLGPVGGGLTTRLNAVYPNATFTVINHGVGAENIDSGVRRLTNSYSYLGLGRNSVISESPDIVVIESFAYNPFPSTDINDALTTHWLRLSAMVDTVKQQLPNAKIVMAVTIAPNWDVFGDGAPGIAFLPEEKRARVEVIKRYLENAAAFAKSQGIPLADAYHPSVDANGNGNLRYINAGDHIHYSDTGRSFFSQTVANTIITNRLLE